MIKESEKEENLDSPPFFKNWSGMYWLVIGTLALLVLLFHFLSNHFS